jgi:hypothetical protein
MPVMFGQEMVKMFRNLGRDIRLTTLLAHVCSEIADYQQFFASPDF